MPRVKIAERKDPLKEIILGRKAAMKLTIADVDEKAGFPEGTFKRLKIRHTDEWKLSQLKTVCYALEIPIETVRRDIGYV